jgi:adenylate cyclase
MPESQPRRLAAILAADVAGYSALMGADDARTVRDLKGHQAVVLPKIAEFGGRIIDTAGDGILAEFASVMNALESAVAIQKMIAERNAGIGPARRMEFRIGVNIGDVIYDDVRILRRRSERGGAVGGVSRARGDLHFGNGLRPREGQTQSGFR